MYRLFLLFSFILGVQAHAQLSMDTLDFWPRARVVPVGQSVVFIEGQYSQASNQLNADGRLDNLGKNRAQKVSWGDVIDSASQAAEKVKIQSELKSRGVDEAETAAIFDFKVEKQQTMQKLGWLYGLSPSWMIGLQVPIVQTSVKVQTSASYAPAVNTMSEETQSRVKTFMKSELQSQGYTDFEEKPNQTSIGDLLLISQHRVYVKGASAVAVRGRWTFPSGQGPRTSDFFDLSSGDGQNDLGADLLFDYVLGRRWSFSTVAGYTAQLPDTVNVRKPVQDGQTVKTEVVRGVKRDLGDIMKLMVSSEFRVFREFRLLGGWVYQQKGSDKFNKNFSDQPESQASMVKMGFQYMPGANTLRREVRNQWLVSLNHWRVLSGKNVVDSATTSLDLMLFY